MKLNAATELGTGKIKKKIDRQLIGLLIFVAAMMVVMTCLSESFLTVSNLTNVFRQLSLIHIWSTIL